MANLFYLMGSSGVGKDSLLNFCREQMDEQSSVKIAQRYITRAAEAKGENHIPLTLEDFEQRRARHDFAMHWQSHSFHYGIGVEINQWLNQNINVVVNGSRAYLPQATAKYPELIPVLITASDQQIHQRLLTRGREQNAEIEQRILRAKKFNQSITNPRLITIDNSGTLEAAGKQLLKIIRGASSTTCV